MALPLIPIIAGAAVRTIARKAIPKLLKTANVGTLGYVGYEAAKEAKKGNYEPLGDLAQSYLLRGAPTLLKAKGAIVIDKNVGSVRKDKQTYIKEATKDPLAKGRVVFDVKGQTTPAKVNIESYNYQRKGSRGTRRSIADTQRLYQESVKRDVQRTGAYTKDIKIDEVQAKAERRAVVSGVRKEIKDAEKRGDPYTEFFMPGKSEVSKGSVNAENVLKRYLKRFFPSIKVTDVKATKATTKLAKKGSGGTDVTKIDTPQETLDKADALSTVAKYTYAKDRKTGKGIFVDNPFSRNVGIKYQNIVGRDEVKNIVQTENIIKQTPTSRALSYMRFLAKSSKTKGLDNKIITNVGSGIPFMDNYGVALLRREFRKDVSNVGKITLKKGLKKGSNKKARELMGEVGGTGTKENVGAYKKFEGSYSPVNRSKEPNVDAAALRKLFAGYFNRNKPKNPKK
tara:strand:- start:552 stop:1913 length:1362 start_codon:yes stop_codon:yes gene_type:complete